MESCQWGALGHAQGGQGGAHLHRPWGEVGCAGRALLARPHPACPARGRPPPLSTPAHSGSWRVGGQLVTGVTGVPPHAPLCRDIIPSSIVMPPAVPGKAVSRSEDPGASHQHPSTHQLPVEPHRHQPGPGPPWGHAATHDPSSGGCGVGLGSPTVPAAPCGTKPG